MPKRTRRTFQSNTMPHAVNQEHRAESALLPDQPQHREEVSATDGIEPRSHTQETTEEDEDFNIMSQVIDELRHAPTNNHKQAPATCLQPESHAPGGFCGCPPLTYNEVLLRNSEATQSRRLRRRLSDPPAQSASGILLPEGTIAPQTVAQTSTEISLTR